MIISSAGQPEDDPRRALNRYFGAVPDVGKDDTYIMSFDAQKRALDNIKKKLSTDEYARVQSHVTAIEKSKAVLPTSPMLQRLISTPVSLRCPEPTTIRPTPPWWPMPNCKPIF